MHLVRIFACAAVFLCCYRIFGEWRFIYYLAPSRVAKYCDQRACLSVCPQTYLKTGWSNVAKFSLHVASGRGSVLPWRRSDMLCISGFINYAILACAYAPLFKIFNSIPNKSFTYIVTSDNSGQAKANYSKWFTRGQHSSKRPFRHYYCAPVIELLFASSSQWET